MPRGDGPGVAAAALPGGARRPTMVSAAQALLVPAILLLAWMAGAHTGVLPEEVLPAPERVLHSLGEMAASGELRQALSATLWRLGWGFLIGAGIGTGLGALCGASRHARALLDPTVQALRSVPSLAWVPLFILWLGIFEASKITLIAVGVFFPVYLNLSAGIGGVDRKLIEVGRVHGLSRLRRLLRIQMPAALPAYITGLRGGLGLGWMFVSAAELLGATSGLGFVLDDGEQTGRPERVLVAILLFGLCGKLSDMALSRLGARLTAWQDVAA